VEEEEVSVLLKMVSCVIGYSNCATETIHPGPTLTNKHVNQ